MKLLSFLQKLEQTSFLSSISTICFVVPDVYPFLFFSLLSRKIKDSIGLVESFDLETQGQVDVLSRLEISNLGTAKLYYWLGYVSGLSPKKKRFWLDYLSHYQGEHLIGFCLNEEDQRKQGNKSLCVLIDKKVDHIHFEQLVSSFQMARPSVVKRMIKHIFPYGGAIDIDKACLLAHYATVVGNNLEQFCDELLPVLLNPEQSLFKITEYFLRKRSKEFFALWAQVKDKYADVFWTSFWSDALWRACYYAQAMRNGKQLEAKKLAINCLFPF